MAVILFACENLYKKSHGMRLVIRTLWARQLLITGVPVDMGRAEGSV